MEIKQDLFNIQMSCSIDQLLRRFDELSRHHAYFLSDFSRYLPDIKNPLRNVERSEEEQQKTVGKILLERSESLIRKSSSNTIEDFHTRTIVSRFRHRPPSYSSSDQSIISRIPSRTTSVSSHKDIPRWSSSTKAPSQCPTITRRPGRPPITVFSMETVNRLAQPKIRPQASIKRAKTIIVKSFTKKSKTRRSSPSHNKQRI
ncbi:unnamed protein product [Adineta ricciae]|uniref:Uncharacterized protein n=1 Tax=Adineta ricciae TaxID=249248 RepID=A0A816CYR2_ADIRI|nr:unnamed protein product [Adineta ricciae]